MSSIDRQTNAVEYVATDRARDRRTHDITEIEDCAIAVDATYYLQQLLESGPSHEPLLPALGGLTGIQMHIETDLSKWEARRITPFFIFDGQSITGQDGVFTSRALKAVEKTDQAWDLYFNGEAESAVSAFGANTGRPNPPKTARVWLTQSQAPSPVRRCTPSSRVS